jgi:type VI secretion system protein ImpH
MRIKKLKNFTSGSIKYVHFFQLVRTIERETGLRLGSDLRPQDEPIFLKAECDSSFPPTEMVSWDATSGRREVTTTFFGLFGPSGALPQHYTELINDRARLKDFGLRDFLDLFNHRLLSFFYRCWEKNRFPIAYETAHTAGNEDTVTKALRGLIGMRTAGLWDSLSFPSQDLMFFAGHFSNRRPTADSIVGMLTSAFDVPIQVEQFIGQLILIRPSEQTKLGTAPLGMSLGNRLGSEAIAGRWVHDFENKFRVKIGPLSYKHFLEFSRESLKLRQLHDYVRTYVGPQFDFDLQLVLKKEEVPTCQLSNADTNRLGWNTWIGDWKKDYDSADAIFELADNQ